MTKPFADFLDLLLLSPALSILDFLPKIYHDIIKFIRNLTFSSGIVKVYHGGDGVVNQASLELLGKGEFEYAIATRSFKKPLAFFFALWYNMT